MSHLERFAAYAAAFEKAYASDDWSLVEPFFTEDAVYEVPLDPPIGGRFEGRPAILAYFKDVTARFDRHFASREIGGSSRRASSATRSPCADGPSTARPACRTSSSSPRRRRTSRAIASRASRIATRPR